MTFLLIEGKRALMSRWHSVGAELAKRIFV